MPARAPALPGWPARARSGPCERLLPFPRRCGRGAGGGGKLQGNRGQGGISVRGHPCPHVPNSLPRQPQSRHNDCLNDSPHSHGRAFTTKALHMSCEEMPARAPALPGWPPARARSGPCERLLPFPRRCGRGAGGRRWGTVDGNDKGTAGREAFRSAGIPAPCVPTKSPDGCIGCRVARQRGTLPHGFTTPATPRSPLAPAGVRHTA